mmetsp:Transcript_56267/g.131930  ORF Transcript_56267/g.131930 Transcript_56267/m.131930 type:complete len:286 (-) Transcript_56267:170-1027(-)
MPIIRDPPKVHSAARSHADEKLRAVLIREGDFEDVGFVDPKELEELRLDCMVSQDLLGRVPDGVPSSPCLRQEVQQCVLVSHPRRKAQAGNHKQIRVHFDHSELTPIFICSASTVALPVQGLCVCRIHRKPKLWPWIRVDASSSQLCQLSSQSHRRIHNEGVCGRLACISFVRVQHVLASGHQLWKVSTDLTAAAGVARGHCRKLADCSPVQRLPCGRVGEQILHVTDDGRRRRALYFFLHEVAPEAGDLRLGISAMSRLTERPGKRLHLTRSTQRFADGRRQQQ